MIIQLLSLLVAGQEEERKVNHRHHHPPTVHQKAIMRCQIVKSHLRATLHQTRGKEEEEEEAAMVVHLDRIKVIHVNPLLPLRLHRHPVKGTAIKVKASRINSRPLLRLLRLDVDHLEATTVATATTATATAITTDTPPEVAMKMSPSEMKRKLVHRSGKRKKKVRTSK